MAYLDSHGLTTFWAKIKAVFGTSMTVDTASTTVDVKLNNGAATPVALSTATLPAATDSKAGVMTAAEHTKLSGIASGAEVNVQSDWNQTNTSADDYIKNKPTIPEGVIASSTTPKMDGTASVGTETAFARGDHVHPTDTSRQAAITSSNKLAYSLISGTPTIPSSTSTVPKMDGTAAVGSETTFAKGDHIHPHDTSKQDVISASNKISYNYLTDTPTIPTNNNQLTNGAGYQTAANVQALIDASMVGAAKYKGTLASNTDYTGLTNYKQGEYWIVSTAFQHGSVTYDVGNMLICNSDYSSSFKDTDFDAIQSDIESIPDSIINALS